MSFNDLQLNAEISSSSLQTLTNRRYRMECKGGSIQVATAKKKKKKRRTLSFTQFLMRDIEEEAVRKAEEGRRQQLKRESHVNKKRHESKKRTDTKRKKVYTRRRKRTA